MPRKPTSLALCVTLALVGVALAADTKDYHDQDLRKHDFTEATLPGANFADAELAGANFSNANLKKSSFKGAGLVDANFKGADISGADFSNTEGPCKFEGTNATGANLEKAKFSAVSSIFKNADLKGARIINAAQNSDFSGADLRNANFRGVDQIQNCRFRGAQYDDDSVWPDGFDPQSQYMTKAAKADAKNDDAAGK
ncbi:MAG TPA: pentapeptide repeat-containing protein [Chthoniobacteraceae bacterium]|nr:pentapeptide repeat-containing protein [Chthoniobacteraceae bacterium]